MLIVIMKKYSTVFLSKEKHSLVFDKMRRKKFQMDQHSTGKSHPFLKLSSFKDKLFNNIKLGTTFFK